MELIAIVLTLVVVGVLMWLINTYVPMAEGVRKLVNAVVVIVLVLWLLRIFGMLNYLHSVRF